MAELHLLRPFARSRKKRKRIGRGLGSGHGAYSTRGIKGQRARSGGSHGLKMRGMKQLILRTPKLGGFRSIHPKPATITLAQLDTLFENNANVNPKLLMAKWVVRWEKGSKPSRIKILAVGTLTKKLSIQGCQASSAAREAIEKAGGTLTP